MCFSATASFSTSLILITCGIIALKYAHEKRLKMIAAIPFIFGLQQFAEGMVWISFLYPHFEPIRMTASYIFLACAGIVWPLWIPLAIGYFEGPRNYKRYVPSLLAGVCCALTFVLYVITYQTSVVLNCNIIYSYDIAHVENIMWSTYTNIIAPLLYITATVVPFFIARHTKLWSIGFLLALSYVVSYVAYLKSFTSVWCFFAALISVLVCGLVSEQARKI